MQLTQRGGNPTGHGFQGRGSLRADLVVARTITHDIGLMRRAKGIWRAGHGIHAHLLCDLDKALFLSGTQLPLLNMAELDSGMASGG